MLKKVLMAGAVIVAGLAVFINAQPAPFTVTRSATIAATPATVFALVNDFHQWDAWSPWAKIDPAMTKSYEGAPTGVGAIYTWSGNNDVGTGRMTIADSTPNESIGVKLEFTKPFSATNIATFTFKPDGNGAAVNWSMSGNKNFMQKAFFLVTDMDKMLGSDFEKGLAQMKTVAEAAAK